MGAILALLPAMLLGAAILGCGDGDDDGDAGRTATGAATATASPTATATPTTGPATPTPTVTPSSAASVASGIELIDAILRAVDQRDAVALESRLHFFLAACTGTQGVAPIPCPAGAAPGTPVQVVLNTTSCEGSFILKGDRVASTAVANFLAAAPEFYAVALRPRAGRDEVIPGDYLALFVQRAGQFAGGGASLTIDEEGVTALAYGCGIRPVQELAGPNPEYLVPPR